MLYGTVRCYMELSYFVWNCQMMYGIGAAAGQCNVGSAQNDSMKHGGSGDEDSGTNVAITMARECN